MFEQLQMVTMSHRHFTVYHSLSVHMSLHLFVFWPIFTGEVLQDFLL